MRLTKEYPVPQLRQRPIEQFAQPVIEMLQAMHEELDRTNVVLQEVQLVAAREQVRQVGLQMAAADRFVS